MKIKIGFITSEPFLPFIEPLREDIENYCDFNILTVQEFIEAIDCYKTFKAQGMDCIIFSGQTLYHIVVERYGTPDIPCFAIDETQGDFKSIFLDLLLENRDFDFTRIFVDFALEVNDYQGIKTLLPENQWPYFNDISNVDSETLIHKTLDKHIKLHESNAIDISITRFGTFCKLLDQKGYRNIYVYPPRTYFFNFIIQVVNSIQYKNSQDQMPACIKIKFTYENEADLFETQSCIETYFNTKLIVQDYTIKFQYYQNHVDVMTTFSLIKDLTKDMLDNSFFSQLKAVCPCVSAIGLGMGTTIFSARENANKSVQFSTSRPDDLYLVNQSNILLGPIGAEDTMKIIGKPNDQLLALSERFGINHINLQKIIGLTTLTQSTLVTGSQLAESLGVTTRSANRFLKQIEDAGGAYSYHEKISEGRGRPVKYYDLTFIKDKNHIQ